MRELRLMHPSRLTVAKCSESLIRKSKAKHSTAKHSKAQQSTAKHRNAYRQSDHTAIQEYFVASKRGGNRAKRVLSCRLGIASPLQPHLSPPPRPDLPQTSR
ncbi:hypothetical protein K432DRAFT_194270 [Lepidopterella palustris CBS 459.81]|uniref:Uncharacterized protein n=1 Tax=Lepidopterella palustris CBS 459.81 TaxID=1314670 RepID=A0A8E2EFZ5_9PEZI|nr:hypothetical protein K432DRAFT_194270 [Lepidopterella palustris CBS 459.81]